MLTRTASQTAPQVEQTPQIIQGQVDERGFYLYEWISSDELRMTLERDYLNIVRVSSIPLAIVTAIAGFIGFTGWIPGTIIAILWVLAVFYGIVGVILTIKFLKRSYIYTRWANVVITDNHYVSAWKIISHDEEKKIQETFWKIESIFDEPFLWESKLLQKKKDAKKELFESLKTVAMGWGKILQNVWRSRDSGWIVVVILIAGFLYATMMGVIYFLWIFFINLFGRLFAWMAHRYLLLMSNTEHRIQTLFQNIQTYSDSLKTGQKNTVKLLQEAGQNAWKENLSGKIWESLELINSLASDATNNSIELRKILESSQYKDIFNFIKYGNWIKTQILEPISEILHLLEKNHITIQKTIVSLENDISNTQDSSLQKPLILQKERLELQKNSYESTMELLNTYKEKLS